MRQTQNEIICEVSVLDKKNDRKKVLLFVKDKVAEAYFCKGKEGKTGGWALQFFCGPGERRATDFSRIRKNEFGPYTRNLPDPFAR